MKGVEQLLMELVAIPSVSPMANKPVVEYAVDCLDPNDWNLQSHSYKDAAGTPKTNLVALTRNATRDHAELTFVCHTDTVPFDAGWSEAIHPVVREDRIYGRGTCDVKGFLACTLAALGQIDVSSLRKAIAVVLTADEEVGCIGAKRLAALKAFSTRYMIIGEPTDLCPVRAGKGYSLATITLRGKEAHSAFPSEGRSAIYDAARVLFCLEHLATELESERNQSFDPPFTTLNVGLIEGGTAKNIVPGECRLTVEWRPVPGENPDRIPGSIRRLLAMLAESTPGLDARLDVHRTDPAFAPSPTQNIVNLLADVTGNQPATIAFGSEAAHLRDLTEETVVFGPGNMTVAHKTGEFVPVPDLHRCVNYLQTAIERTCMGE
jgi:acetylornithine deacetylase